MIFTIFLFLVILSVLVFVHEWGHFTLARRNGMKVDEFGFGFPPRMGGIIKDEETGKWKFVFGNKNIQSRHTIFSINWIPLGGFVRIKGEDGTGKDDPESFASKSAWARIKVLVAGVAMNFVLAWVLFSIIGMVGVQEGVDDTVQDSNAYVLITNIGKGTPAESMGLQAGDVMLELASSGEGANVVRTAEDAQEYIRSHKGVEVAVTVRRGEATLQFSGTPRKEFPQSEGSLGIQMVRVHTVQYAWYEALWLGAKQTWMFTAMILSAFVAMIYSLITGNGITADLAGPVGIAYITKQVAELGIVHVLNFAAILSVNLGIINILPIPALDGGRVFFVLLEVINKGKAVSQKFEHALHTASFLLLIVLMILVTVHDFSRFEILKRITNLFE